jgi:hypothetical protein
LYLRRAVAALRRLIGPAIEPFKFRALLPITPAMSSSPRTERRRSLVDRRQPPRPLKCRHCGVLLAFERRDGLVTLYRSSAPPHAVAPQDADGPAAVPRCVVCYAPVVVPADDE